MITFDWIKHTKIKINWNNFSKIPPNVKKYIILTTATMIDTQIETKNGMPPT